MKVITYIRKSLKILLWTVMAIFLLLSAVLLLVYSPWSQNDMRRFAVEMMNRNGLKTEIAALRLKFPLDIEVEGLKLDMPGQAISA